jgi:tRNA(fMet)-specific endonuclease VapC
MDKIALDTNVVIKYFIGDKNVILNLKNTEKFYLPFPVAGELLYGANNSKKAGDNLQKLNEFFSDNEVSHSNQPVCEIYSDIRKQLKENGKPIPENDIWIAAVCKYYDCTISTFDKHFLLIPGIKILTFKEI